MSCTNYKIIFNDETKYVTQDITDEPVVRVISSKGERGPQGEPGPQGPQGPQGPKGEDGAGIEVSGSVSTYENLPTNLTPEDNGKGYYVEEDGKLYIWNGSSFPSKGNGVQIQGPQGPQGIQGEQGPQGIQGPAGSNGEDGFSPIATVTQTSTGATISITDSQGTTTANIANGSDANVPIATTSIAGKVKPDGSTIIVDQDGTITATATSQVGSKVYYGTISGGPSTQLKKVTVSNDFVLEQGIILVLKTSSNNNMSPFRFKINGVDVSYWVSVSSYETATWYPGEIITLTCTNVDQEKPYNSHWEILNHNIADADYYGRVKIGSDYTSQATDTVPTNSQLYSVYTLANGKQNALTAGTNITIENDTISATDTTYSDFVGTDGTAVGTAGLVPAPAASDSGKFLKADGTWDTAGKATNNINSTDWNALWQ